MRRSTSRRACRSPRRARVMRRSAYGRSSFAFASVVTMRSCLKRLVARFASNAFLWLDVRESCLPLARCRTLLFSAHRGLRHRCGARLEHLHGAAGLFKAHAEVQPFAPQQLRDLAQGLLADVFHLEQVAF